MYGVFITIIITYSIKDRTKRILVPVNPIYKYGISVIKIKVVYRRICTAAAVKSVGNSQN